MQKKTIYYTLLIVLIQSSIAKSQIQCPIANRDDDSRTTTYSLAPQFNIPQKDSLMSHSQIVKIEGSKIFADIKCLGEDYGDYMLIYSPKDTIITFYPDEYPSQILPIKGIQYEQGYLIMVEAQNRTHTQIKSTQLFYIKKRKEKIVSEEIEMKIPILNTHLIDSLDYIVVQYELGEMNNTGSTSFEYILSCFDQAKKNRKYKLLKGFYELEKENGKMIYQPKNFSISSCNYNDK